MNSSERNWPKSKNSPPLPPAFYLRPTPDVARALLGKALLVRQGQWDLVVQITEVEAYLGSEDPASHAYRGRTPRNLAMFSQGGIAYVYVSYGMHFCVNVVTGPEGVGQAVLLRAGIPLWGHSILRKNRERTSGPLSSAPEKWLTGPGKLTQALGIQMKFNQRRLDEPDFRLVDLGFRVPKTEILVTPRIGISRAQELPLRFVWRFASLKTDDC